MDILRVLVIEEQQALSLVALGVLSLVVALTIRNIVKPGKGTMRQVFWLLQALLMSTGVVMLVWPSLGFAAVTVAVIGCVVLVQRLDWQNRRERGKPA